MAGMKNIMIALAALLLVAGAGAGGYLYGHQNENTNGSAPVKVEVPNFPSILSMGDDSGTDCVADFNDGSGSCTFADGTKQVVEIDNDHINFHLYEKNGKEAECLQVPVPKLDLSKTDDSEDGEPLIKQIKTEGRIKSWTIRVPDSLNALAEDGTGISELEYFEKDGEAWRAEFFEKGNKEPTIIQLGEGKDGVKVPSNAQCAAPTDMPGRSLGAGEEIAIMGGTAAAGAATKAVMGVACGFGPVACVGAGLVILGAMWGAAIGCTGGCGGGGCGGGGGCRRRRFLTEGTASRMLRSSAMKTQLGPELFRIGGESVRMLAASAVAGSVITAAVSSADTTSAMAAIAA